MIAKADRIELLNPETAVLFGEFDHLVGVVNHATDFVEHSDFAVIMVTAGVLPSSGPFRLHVDLADSLYRNGVTSLRFDLSGIGESLAIGGEGTSLERASREISSAIDWLQDQLSIDRVALFGLCSGADDALFAAGQDDRITGLFCIDGCGYRTSKFYAYRMIRNHIPKLLSIRAWQNRLLNRRNNESTVHESLRLGNDVREFPDRDTAARQIADLVLRGVDLHFHYTGGVGDYYNYEQQFYEMFSDSPAELREAIRQVTTSFSPDSDHVAYLLEHREAVVERATARLLQMMRSGKKSRQFC